MKKNSLLRIVTGILFVFATGVFSQTYMDTLNTGKELMLPVPSPASIATKGTPSKTSSSIVDDIDAAEKSEEVATPGNKINPRGFRIQIAAGSAMDAMKKKKAELEETIMIPLYIVFESPYYKLLAGNFKDRAAADAELKKVKANGFPDAWIVQSEIIVRD